MWFAHRWPVCDVQPLGFLPSCDGFGHYVVIGIAHGSGTVAVVPFGPSPGVTAAHLVVSVSVVMALIHEQHRKDRRLSVRVYRIEFSRRRVPSHRQLRLTAAITGST